MNFASIRLHVETGSDWLGGRIRANIRIKIRGVSGSGQPDPGFLPDRISGAPLVLKTVDVANARHRLPPVS